MVVNGQTLNGWMTTTEAAEKLGVSRLQIARLARDEELDAIRSSGGVYLVNAESLERYRLLFRGKGRPWDKNVSWAALWILSGLMAEWLTYSQRQRLSTRLINIEATDLVWAVRKRSKTIHFRLGESFFPSAKDMLSVSGVSSDIMLLHGLMPQTKKLEGYIDEQKLEEFKTKCHAVQGEDANAIIHIISNPQFTLSSFQQMPLAASAVDLCASLDARERGAGIDALKGLFDARN
jgi:excisionase family DNA binding protein